MKSVAAAAAMVAAAAAADCDIWLAVRCWALGCHWIVAVADVADVYLLWLVVAAVDSYRVLLAAARAADSHRFPAIINYI